MELMSALIFTIILLLISITKIANMNNKINSLQSENEWLTASNADLVKTIDLLEVPVVTSKKRIVDKPIKPKMEDPATFEIKPKRKKETPVTVPEIKPIVEEPITVPANVIEKPKRKVKEPAVKTPNEKIIKAAIKKVIELKETDIITETPVEKQKVKKPSVPKPFKQTKK